MCAREKEREKCVRVCELRVRMTAHLPAESVGDGALIPLSDLCDQRYLTDQPE